MSERYVKWNELTPLQQSLAAANYASIREREEEKPCSYERSLQEAPLCRGFWIDTEDDWIVTCNI